MTTRYDLVTEEVDINALAIDIARNQVGMRLPIAELLVKLGISDEKFLAMSKNDLFKRQVKKYAKEFEEKGIDFQLKAKIILEDVGYKSIYQMLGDPDTPHATKSKIIADLVRWAGLEPKANMQESGASGLQIIFNIPSGPPATPNNLSTIPTPTQTPAIDVQVTEKQVEND